MFKKSFIALSFLALVGCGSSNYQSHYQQAEPKYKISDEDTKKWIIVGNKREQCVFSKLYKNKNFNELSPIEQQLYFNGVFWGSLAEVIGIDNVKIIASDPASLNYTGARYDKFNHTDPVHFDQQWCTKEKKEYVQALKRLKLEQEKQKKEELVRKRKAEKERKAREAYLATPQGQAELSRQQIAVQHQQMMAQQQKMYNLMLAQQKAAQDQAYWQQQQQQQMMQQQQFNQNMQMLNQMNNQFQIQGGYIGQGWAPTSGVHWNNVY